LLEITAHQREFEMRMGVDKTGKDNRVAVLSNIGLRELLKNLLLRTNASDRFAIDRHCATFDW